jgi:hypothetical protein
MVKANRKNTTVSDKAQRGDMTDVEPKKPRRQKKKMSREERMRHREKMRKWRAGKIDKDAVSKPTQPIEPAPKEATTSQSLTQEPTPEAVAMAVAAEKEKDKLEFAQDMAAGLIESAAEITQRIWLDNQAPHLGHERSCKLASIWAPIIAKRLPDDARERYEMVSAAALTASVLFAWIDDYQTYKEKPITQLRTVETSETTSEAS